MAAHVPLGSRVRLTVDCSCPERLQRTCNHRRRLMGGFRAEHGCGRTAAEAHGVTNAVLSASPAADARGSARRSRHATRVRKPSVELAALSLVVRCATGAGGDTGSCLRRGASVTALSSSCGTLNAALADARFGQSPACGQRFMDTGGFRGRSWFCSRRPRGGNRASRWGPSRRGLRPDKYRRL
jgi:hypothetical protein